jgi:hypothetical protein
MRSGYANHRATATPAIDLSSGPYGTLYTVGMTKDASGLYAKVLDSRARRTYHRFGWYRELRQFARHFVLPFMDADPRSALPHRREETERLREVVG